MDRDNANEAVQGNTSGKGKGKETAPSSQPRISADSASGGLPSYTDSIMSRLSSSATQLARGLITSHATAADIVEAQPSSKAGPSAATPSKNYNPAADTGMHTLNPAAAASGRSFRSSQASDNDASIETDFSAFLDDGIRLEHPVENRFDYPSRPDFAQSRLQHHGQNIGPAAKPVEDGLEVVKFLDDRYDEVMSEDPVIPLLVGEQEMLRRAFFQDDGQWKRKPLGNYQEDILNFFPDFVFSGIGKSADMSNHLGVSDPENARMIWVNHWQDVLSTYTDEVWGDLSHLVEEARKELRTLSNSPEQAHLSGPGALRRLQQILAHVRRF